MLSRHLDEDHFVTPAQLNIKLKCFAFGSFVYIAENASLCTVHTILLEMFNGFIFCRFPCCPDLEKIILLLCSTCIVLFFKRKMLAVFCNNERESLRSLHIQISLVFSFLWQCYQYHTNEVIYINVPDLS